MNKLHIAEHFLSVQGEGLSVGMPAVFIRLQHCILECKWCDTVEVWKQGRAYLREEFHELLRGYYKEQRLYTVPRLVITGGEPLMQQKVLAEWLDEFVENTDEEYGLGAVPVVEVETAGVLMPSAELRSLVKQWNVSPKLDNSGESFVRRFNPKTLAAFGQIDRSNEASVCWKFVIGRESDLDEVHSILDAAYLLDDDMGKVAVYLMPEAKTRAEFLALAPNVAEWCKATGYRFGNRLQLICWDKATGV